MKRKLLIAAKDEAGSTLASSPASSDATAQLVKYELMASATPAQEAIEAFNQMTFGLGTVSHKSLLLRLPTLNGNAIATIKYDMKTTGAEVYGVISNLGIPDDTFYIHFGTIEGASRLEKFDVVSSFSMDDGQTMSVALKQI